MKKCFPLIGLALVIIAISAYFKLQTLPQPTTAQLAAAFPENSHEIFRKSDRFILYRILSRQSDRDDIPTLHGYPIVGQTEIRDKTTQLRIINAYEAGLADTRSFKAACFVPAHAIRIEKNNQRLDLLVCFKCSQVKVLFKEHQNFVKIGKQAQATFDTVLDEAGVPQASVS